MTTRDAAKAKTNGNGEERAPRELPDGVVRRPAVELAKDVDDVVQRLIDCGRFDSWADLAPYMIAKAVEQHLHDHPITSFELERTADVKRARGITK